MSHPASPTFGGKRVIFDPSVPEDVVIMSHAAYLKAIAESNSVILVKRASERPTIAELEELLARKGSENVKINPDGSVSSAPSASDLDATAAEQSAKEATDEPPTADLPE